VNPEDAAADVLGDWYARGSPEAPEDLIRSHPDLEAPLREALLAGERLDRAFGARRGTGVPGGRVLGDFRVGREIGRGGMGVVYEAEQVSLARRVALKVLHPAVTFGPKAVERFRREARTAGSLVHPHVVPVYAMGEADGVCWYAMEWVRGTTLAQAIDALRGAGEAGAGDDVPAGRSPFGSPSDGRAHYARLAAAVAGVADALHAAHGAGVVHRDVKPANLVIDGAGAMKVMDFGLAFVEGEVSRTVTGDLLGTPAYMSPEQAGGGHVPVDARSDVYSLGATLYEAVALRPPFEGRDAYAVCARVLSRDPVPPRRHEPRVPRDLETIVLRAMEKDPGRRYPDARAMADDLRAFAEGRAIRARRVGPLARAARVARRHPAATALATAVLLLAAAVGHLALGAASGDGGSARPGPPATSAWKELPSLSVASYALAAAVVEGKAYAISGFFTPRVEVYDPAARAWRPAAPLPRAVQYASVAVAEGRIHLFGGDSGTSEALASTLVYDPAADAWSVRAPMPGGPRWASGAAAIGGKVYVVGGTDGSPTGALDRLEVYDPAADAWTTRTPLPEPRVVSGAAAAIGGRLYVAGGHRGTTLVRRLDAYDPATDTWEEKAPPPVAIATQAAVVRGRLVLAGAALEGEEGVVHAYDPQADAWSALPPMSGPRRAHGVAYDEASNTLYAIGGYRHGAWLPTVEALSPSLPPR
jgi:N-acetylneuraminic acid mutarotase